MKIYTRLVLDMDTFAALEEDSFEYAGPLAECKVQEAGSSTTYVQADREYNARMAAVAEAQQALSDKYFDWWQQKQAPVEEAMLQSQLELLPQQTELAQEGLTGLKGVQQNFYALSAPKSSTLAAGQAQTDVNRALSSAQDTMSRDMSRMGVNPASGASLSGMRNLSLQGAAMQANAANAARQQNENDNLKRLTSAMQIGQM